jgi:TRAP transporter TAXI family solute receptor
MKRYLATILTTFLFISWAMAADTTSSQTDAPSAPPAATKIAPLPTTDTKPTSAPATAIATTTDAATTTAAKPDKDTQTQPQPPVDNPDQAKSDQNLKPYMDDKLIVIGTGNVSGIYYPAGGIICRLMNRDRKTLGIRCAVESSDGSIANLQMLDRDEIDFGLVQSDWQENAYYGLGAFKDERVEKLRFILSLHSETFTVIIKRNSDIKTFDDLKGRAINTGAVGSGSRATWDELMRAKGWQNDMFKKLSDLKAVEQPSALCNNEIDAIILLTGHPNGIVDEIAKSCDITILDVNDSEVVNFIAANPEYVKSIIPSGIYASIPEDVTTFGVKTTLVSTTDTSEDIVYKLTKQIFENLDVIKAINPVFNQLDTQKMVTEGRTAPIHPGALKYYKEKNFNTN